MSVFAFNIMKEIFKEVKNCKDYQISNFGNLKSMKWGKEKILKPEMDRNGYLRYSLSNNNLTKRYLSHRLVLTAFVPNPENKPCVNHINGIKTDNRVENLEWVTYSENRLHSHLNNLQNYAKGESCSYSKLKEKEVLEILEIGKTKTQLEISKIYKVSRRHISDILNGKRWSHIKIKKL